MTLGATGDIRVGSFCLGILGKSKRRAKLMGN
jgi:hypothetical protein